MGSSLGFAATLLLFLLPLGLLHYCIFHSFFPHMWPSVCFHKLDLGFFSCPVISPQSIHRQSALFSSLTHSSPLSLRLYILPWFQKIILNLKNFFLRHSHLRNKQISCSHQQVQHSLNTILLFRKICAECHLQFLYKKKMHFNDNCKNFTFNMSNYNKC